MVLLVKIYVGAERRRAGSDHDEEQIEPQQKEHPTYLSRERGGRLVAIRPLHSFSGSNHETLFGYPR